MVTMGYFDVDILRKAGTVMKRKTLVLGGCLFIYLRKTLKIQKKVEKLGKTGNIWRKMNKKPEIKKQISRK